MGFSGLWSNLQRISGVKLTEREKLLDGSGVHKMLRGSGEVALRFVPDGKHHGRYKTTKLKHVFKIHKRGNLDGPIVDDQQLKMALVGCRGHETNSPEVVRVQKLLDQHFLRRVRCNLPNDERDYAVGCSGKTGMSNQVEGANFPKLTGEVRFLEIDGTKFFANGTVERHAVQIAAMTTSQVRRQRRQYKILCPERPAVLLSHAGSRMYDASQVECQGIPIAAR